MKYNKILTINSMSYNMTTVLYPIVKCDKIANIPYLLNLYTKHGSVIDNTYTISTKPVGLLAVITTLFPCGKAANLFLN